MASDQEPGCVKGNWQVSSLKPIFRRPKAIEDVEQHATYIADGSIDTALRFLERAEQTIRNQLGVSMWSYRSWARLRRTAELMATAPTLTDAAVHAGFYDAAHFTRTFTATFGVLPSDVFAQDLDVHVVEGLGIVSCQRSFISFAFA